ncbi:toxin-activating lysine-acyltransferase [Methylobacterium sp. R2-1]|uniref:toxin-activating lysine-acyltransferase n=1 Tax=Methylobacterium sp. R2-1 TaxID=2587064 RepID=UPI0016087D09|nr:toxin-activating lysine-acyltransferase [Methylobacterium sp. R2-1]MBB2964477.1 cytolysin-activating lysine-acyltransferase [Methylobacterium sp. R2-1]
MIQHPSSESSDQSRSDKTVSTIFGEIVWLISRSLEHREISVGDLEQIVMVPLLLRQIRLFYDGNQPAAVVLYAQVSASVADRLDAGTALTELTIEDWQSGKILRVMMVVAPYGGAEIYAQETLSFLGKIADNAPS